MAGHNNVIISGATATAVSTNNGSICGTKFDDVNGNGRQDAGEPGIKGWQITIGDLTVTTDENGNYCFTDLKAGDYTIKEVMQTGWEQTAPPPGHHTVTLAAGQNLVGRSFGNRRVVSDTPVKTGGICGIKFNDLNGNGARDPGEPGLPGWQIHISGPTDTSVITNSQGNYCVMGLLPGIYTIAEVEQPGWVQTTPPSGHHSLAVAADHGYGDKNFGNRRVTSDTPVKPDGPISVGPISVNPNAIMLAQLGSICGTKFNDANRNGVRDPGEPGLSGWQVTISGPADSTVVTDAQGNYCFTGLNPGTYTISEVMQSGWMQTAPSSPANYTVVLADGQNVDNRNFGNWRSPAFPSAISGTKFNDANGNGVRDPGEPGLSGWQIHISGSQTSMSGSVSFSVITDAQGNYLFNGLWPGTYTIAEVGQLGWAQTAPSSGFYTVGLASGQGLGGKNFGNRRITPDTTVVVGTGTVERLRSRTDEAPRQLEKLMEAYRNRRMDAFMGYFAPDFRGNRDEIRRNTEKDWDVFSSIDIEVIPVHVIPNERTVEIEFNWRNNSRYRNGAMAERQGRSRIEFRPGAAIFDRWGIIAIEGDPILGAGFDHAPKPRVISYSPRGGQSGVALNEAVVFDFTMDMDPGSLRTALTIDPAIDLTYDAIGRRFTVKPQTVWRANTSYTVTLTDAAASTTGAPLDDVVEFSFRTVDDATSSDPTAGSPAW
jgi:protocatechuate 3,4-dioxygenase beta subunit